MLQVEMEQSEIQQLAVLSQRDQPTQETTASEDEVQESQFCSVRFYKLYTYRSSNFELCGCITE